MGDWQTTNIFADVAYGKHTVSVRVTNGSQICYGVKVFNETDFDACRKLNCDGIVIVAKDDANNETNTIPRGPNKTLKTLNLSAISLDGADLSKGVTYLWERRAISPDGTSGYVAFSSTQAAVSIGVPGRYTLKMVRGTTTCTTEIAINAKPCTDPPDPTGAIACTTPALTAVADEAANRLPNLAPGDVVRCGDFNITIIEATGNANGWNGKSYVKVPYLNARLSIILRNAVFNDCYQLTNANATAELPTVYTEYDPKWGNVVDVDRAFETLEQFKSSVTQIIDLLDGFNCSTADINRVQKDIDSFENRIKTLYSYSETEKQERLALLNTMKQSFEDLKTCCASQPARTGRIAAPNDDCNIAAPNDDCNGKPEICAKNLSLLANGCIANKPTITNPTARQVVPTNGIITSITPFGGPTTSPCTKTWGYFEGNTLLGESGINAGWYEKKEFDDLVDRIVRIVGNGGNGITNLLFIHGTNSDVDAFRDEFKNRILALCKRGGIHKSVHWSGNNNAISRTEAVKQIFKEITTANNYPKHLTIISHSHGGNVSKLLKNQLENAGYVIDIINIETPQRADFQTLQKGGGIYLNFYAESDLIQWLGVHLDVPFNSQNPGSLGHRKDPNAEPIGNIHLIPYWTMNTIPDAMRNVIQWAKSTAGHSLQNDEKTDWQIYYWIDKFFR